MRSFEINNPFSAHDKGKATPFPTSSTCHKPVEIYFVIDPFCPECWAMEPIIKKLWIEYGRYFTFRYIIGGKLDSLNSIKRKRNDIRTVEQIAEAWKKTVFQTGMCCEGDIWLEAPISTPFLGFIAIKAAELQGKQAGMRFLRRMREMLFLQKQNICKRDVLIQIAEKAALDVNEFIEDIHSEAAVKALKSDLKFYNDMEIDHTPTLVFFNNKADEEGIKVTGCQSYNVYVEVISELLAFTPKPAPLPPVEEFMKKYTFVGTKELSFVYDTTCSEMERRMKKLVLQQVVEKIPVKHGAFWNYTGQ